MSLPGNSSSRFSRPKVYITWLSFLLVTHPALTPNHLVMAGYFYSTSNRPTVKRPSESPKAKLLWPPQSPGRGTARSSHGRDRDGLREDRPQSSRQSVWAVALDIPIRIVGVQYWSFEMHIGLLPGLPCDFRSCSCRVPGPSIWYTSGGYGYGVLPSG